MSDIPILDYVIPNHRRDPISDRFFYFRGLRRQLQRKLLAWDMGSEMENILSGDVTSVIARHEFIGKCV